MNRLVVFFCVIFVFISIIAVFYYRTKGNQSPYPFKVFNKSTDWPQAGFFLLSDCKYIPPFDLIKDNQSYRNYYASLFLALDKKITYDPNINFFVSPSKKNLSIYPHMAEKNPNVLLQQKLVCFVAMMEDTPTEGNVAYESKTGKIKVLRVKNYPVPITN